LVSELRRLSVTVKINEI